MVLTSTSLGSIEAISFLHINNAFKNFVISRLHFGMCKKSKLKENFEVQEVLTWNL